MTHAEIRAAVDKIQAEWRPRLGLEGWDIRILYDETKLLGSARAVPSYGQAILGFNLKRMKRELPSYRLLEELVLHELVHCLAWRESERVVSQLTRGLLRAKYQDA